MSCLFGSSSILVRCDHSMIQGGLWVRFADVFWQMVESPGCARSAPLERRRRDGRSARQRRRSTLAHGGVTGEARIILRSPIHMSSCTRTCTRVHVAKIVSVATGTPCTVLKSEKKVNGHGLFFCCALRASQNFWPIRGEIGVKPHSDQLIGVG